MIETLPNEVAIRGGKRLIDFAENTPELYLCAPENRQTQALAELTKLGRATCEELFQSVFGQKYVRHLHYSGLHQVLSRIRRNWGVKLAVAGGEIQAPSVLRI